MKNVGVQFLIHPMGTACQLNINAMDGPLSIPEYLEVVDAWLVSMRAMNAQAIKEFEEAKVSGKIVQLKAWKK